MTQNHLRIAFYILAIFAYQKMLIAKKVPQKILSCPSDMIAISGDGAFKDFCISANFERMTIAGPGSENDNFKATLSEAKEKCQKQTRVLCSFEQRDVAKNVLPFPKPGTSEMGSEWVRDPLPENRKNTTEGTSIYWGTVGFSHISNKLPFHCCKIY